jgi:hypothetical protein
MTIRNIAEQNSISPIDVYEVIRETTETRSQST